MTATKQFLEDMVQGGFFGENVKAHITILGGAKYHDDVNVAINGRNHRATLAAWLLNPNAWKAVFKDEYEACWACAGEKYFRDFFTNEVDKNRPCGNCNETGKRLKSTWKDVQHQFVDHLADGCTIEESLSKLV